MTDAAALPPPGLAWRLARCSRLAVGTDRAPSASAALLPASSRPQVLKSRTKFEKACSMAVEKGDVLERDDTKAKATGTLYDMVIVSSVKCPVSGGVGRRHLGVSPARQRARARPAPATAQPAPLPGPSAQPQRPGACAGAPACLPLPQLLVPSLPLTECPPLLPCPAPLPQNGHYKVRYEARGIKPKSGKSTKRESPRASRRCRPALPCSACGHPPPDLTRPHALPAAGASSLPPPPRARRPSLVCRPPARYRAVKGMQTRLIDVFDSYFA